MAAVFGGGGAFSGDGVGAASQIGNRSAGAAERMEQRRLGI